MSRGTMPVNCIQRAGIAGRGAQKLVAGVAANGGAPTEAAHQVAEAEGRAASHRGRPDDPAGRQPSQRRNRPTSSSSRQE